MRAVLAFAVAVITVPIVLSCGTPEKPAGVAPQITTQPTAQSAAEGATATFTVAASGDAPLAYQWRRGGTDVAGATAVSWTTPSLTVADDGALISVRVSNGAGSVISDEVRLTVTQSLQPVAVLKAGGSFTSPDGHITIVVPPDALTNDGTVLFRPIPALTLPADPELGALEEVPESTWRLEFSGTELKAGADLGVYVVLPSMRDKVAPRPGDYVSVRLCTNNEVVAAFGDSGHATGYGAGSGLSCAATESSPVVCLRRYAPPVPPSSQESRLMGAPGYDVVLKVVGSPRGGAVQWQPRGDSAGATTSTVNLTILGAGGGHRFGFPSYDGPVLAYDGAGTLLVRTPDCHVDVRPLVLRAAVGQPLQVTHRVWLHKSFPLMAGQCSVQAGALTRQGVVVAELAQLHWFERTGEHTVAFQTQASQQPRVFGLHVAAPDESVWVVQVLQASSTCDGECPVVEHYTAAGAPVAALPLGTADGLRLSANEPFTVPSAIDAASGDLLVAAPMTEQVLNGTTKVGRIQVTRVTRTTGALAWAAMLPQSNGSEPASVSTAPDGTVAVTSNYGSIDSGPLGTFAWRVSSTGMAGDPVTLAGMESRPPTFSEVDNNAGGWTNLGGSVVHVGTFNGATATLPPPPCVNPMQTGCTDLFITRFTFP